METVRESTEELPRTKSCFAFMFVDKKQNPRRLVLVHNNADPKGPNGKEGKPAGWGLPGGGNRDKDEKPYEEEVDFSKGKFGGTVRREVLGEAGLWTKIATHRQDSEFGEILYEKKEVEEKGRPAINEVHIFVFHLENLSEGIEQIIETSETRRVAFADLGSILMMPRAFVKKYNYKPDGSVESVEIVDRKPEGIYFSARERIFGVVEYLGLDLYELIPDFDSIFPEIKKEEVGNIVWDILVKAIEKKKEEQIREARLAEEARLRREKILGFPEDDELLERYADWVDSAPNDLTR